MNEIVFETKACRQCSESFEITQADKNFYEKVSPSFAWEKYLIPSPTLCPDCRQQRRLTFRNERTLYKRKCDATGKGIISMYSPESQLQVYSEDVWWSDKWDALSYGINFEVHQNFFSQFQELYKKIPQPPLINNFRKLENSNYSNYSWNLKDCYLAYECASCDGLYYGESNRHIENSLDLSMSTRCQECYFCFNIFDCHKIYFSHNSENCSDSYYLKNCKNCSNCYNCQNLSHKKYCIENIQYSEQEYLKKLSELQTWFHEPLFFSRNNTGPVLHMNTLWSEEVTGDYIFHSKQVYSSYHVKNLENGKYCSYLSSSSKKSQDCYDYDYFWWVEKVYETITSGSGSQNISFCFNTWEASKNMLYSGMCYTSENCFWCVWLVGKQYCILNKQYSKEEYEELVPKIIEHMRTTWEWGEFFPASISPFGYNETVAQEYFPLTKWEAKSQKFNWSDYEAPLPKVDKIIPASKLPENIADIPDDILNWAIECEVSKKPFRIISQELNFYRKHNLPIPKRHPDQRHLDRMKLRNPRKLYARNCDKCSLEMQTSYAPEREERVYCEKCYNTEIS